MSRVSASLVRPLAEFSRKRPSETNVMSIPLVSKNVVGLRHAPGEQNRLNTMANTLNTHDALVLSITSTSIVALPCRSARQEDR